MSRWFRDTLFVRLFLLMWVALVASHLAAFGLVFGFSDLPRPAPGELSWRDVPTLPSLPPTPGLPDSVEFGRPRPPPGGTGDSLAALPPFESARHFDGEPGAGGEGGRMTGPRLPHRPHLPTPLLLLDYLVRLVVIAAAAAIGARWLVVPVRRLIGASQKLTTTLGSAAPPPVLDERSGTVEVREAARVFNRMASELDAQFKGRGLLIASLSHDLKTPLTRMRMRLENEPPGATARRSIADIEEMRRLLDESLDVFREAAGNEPMQAVDVRAVLESIADDLGEQGRSVEVSGASTVVRARSFDLRRVFDNLIGNAVRYGTKAGVEIAVDGSRVTITIEDDGPGIPPAMLEAVFQPFFRVENSRSRSSGGSGLGLYIARDLLRRQGGEIRLSNRPLGGLQVVVTLPIASST